MSAPLMVSELIEQQESALNTLEQILIQEKDILTKRDPQALVDITEKKHELLLAVEQQDKQISIHPHFKREYESNLHDDALARISEILERCKTLNHVNGNIIAQSELAVDRMRNTLLERNSKSTMTYDAKGKKSGGLSSLGIKA
ncbi:flagella synthesis protein FlgN [Thalassotalea eurytherma]|uniref:Flagellar protein FlgN n=1 Tax=Thalassotalea eurytherma TaxID=1144278 RepID=A0ABQ6HB38_9GAMM|nr:flagellar protein FlgN [Thalassotalea eurytherma]GLX83676.1 hypothetical protein theurythT_31290 [Thalassotalea eurytherma]